MNNFTGASGANLPGGDLHTQNQAKAAENLPKFEKSIKTVSHTDGLFALIFLILGYIFIIWLGFPLPRRQNLKNQIRIIIFTALYMGAVVSYGHKKGIEPAEESKFWAVILACQRIFIPYSNGAKLLLMIPTRAYFTFCRGNGFANRKESGRYMAADMLNCYVLMPFANFFTGIPALGRLIFKGEKNRKPQKGYRGQIAFGLLMAFFALSLVMPLLAGADSNFSFGFLRDFSKDFFGSDFMVKFRVYTFFALPVAGYIYGLAFSAMSREKYGALSPSLGLKIRQNMQISYAVSLKIFLWAVCGVYIRFMLLQADYILGVFAGRLFAGMTWSQYAREGFGQLCTVAGINLGFLAICTLLVKDSRENKKLTGAKTALCVLSLLLLATALAKMIMYMYVFGLTEKRIISTVFLLWLAGVFIMYIINLRKPFNIAKSALVRGAVICTVMLSFNLKGISDGFNRRHGYDENISVYTQYRD